MRIGSRRSDIHVVLLWVLCTAAVSVLALVVSVAPGFGQDPLTEPTAGAVEELQRILAKEFNRQVATDGRFGPQTLAAYTSARRASGFPELASLGQAGDILLFNQKMWNRKLALLLLHRFGILAGDYSLRSEDSIREALAELSTRLGNEESYVLESPSLLRLQGEYEANPPTGSLAQSVQQCGLPPTGLTIYLRAFKKEAELEVWARPARSNSAFTMVKLFGITDSPFQYPANPQTVYRAGPKTVEGDVRVPEGCYKLTWQNEWSTFWLGYLLSYPTAADRIRRDYWDAGSRPGGQIVLHGSNVSVGCIPIGHPGIEELYLFVSRNRQEPVRIDIFPCRFGTSDNEQILAEYAALRPEFGEFWDGLRSVFQVFEYTRLVPNVVHDPKTGYWELR